MNPWVVQRLCEAIRASNFEQTQALLAGGGNFYVNLTDRLGHTPLWYAIHHGHLRLVELLLANRALVVATRQQLRQIGLGLAAGGPPVEVKPLPGYLQQAIRAHSLDDPRSLQLLELLLETGGAPVDSPDGQTGRTALAEAVLHRPGVVGWLLRQKASPVARDSLSESVLSLAVRCRAHPETLRLLLTQALVVEGDPSRHRPHRKSAARENRSLVHLAAAAGASGLPALEVLLDEFLLPVDCGPKKAWSALRLEGPLVPWTPLEVAAETGDLAVVKYLLERGAPLAFGANHVSEGAWETIRRGLASLPTPRGLEVEPIVAAEGKEAEAGGREEHLGRQQQVQQQQLQALRRRHCREQVVAAVAGASRLLPPLAALVLEYDLRFAP